MRQRRGFKKRWLSTVVSLVFVFAFEGKVEAQKIKETPELVEAGKRVYEKKCINCHGEKGDGKGPAASFLFPVPRDFTMGIFKMKTTPKGELITGEDLFNVITRGMPGSSMSGWAELSPEDRWGLVYYIQTFSEKFARAKDEGKYPPPTINVGDPIPSSPESIKKGEDIFVKLECDLCHGEAGRGGGYKALKLHTKWGGKVLPRDLTRRWFFRRSSNPTPQDIYLTLRIGMEGTPMPSFAEDLDNWEEEEEEEEEEVLLSEGGGGGFLGVREAIAAEEEGGGFNLMEMSGEERTWHLVNYVLSLSQEERPKVGGAYTVKRVEGALPDDIDDKRWDEVPLNEYPLVGQTIVDPRMFTPRIDFVQLKALYNEEEIAFLLIWHDLSKMTRPDPERGFSADAIALQFPQKIPDGRKLPYFLNGDPENTVYLLHWSTDKDGITEMNANGMDRVAVQEAEQNNAKGAVSYSNGEYRLLIKRPLTTEDQVDLQFEPGRFIPVAFSAWEGSNGETETKRSISAWYFIILEPPIRQEVYYYPLLVVFGVAVGEAIIIRRARKKEKEGRS